MSWDELSSDVVRIILEYAWWNELSPIGCIEGTWLEKKFKSQYYDRLRIMRYMRLSKTTYVAVKKMRSLWITILANYGPKRIGPTSKHCPSTYKCKLNAEGRCHVAQHYGQTLEPAYDTTQQFGAYDAVIKWGSNKVLSRLRAAVRQEQIDLHCYMKRIASNEAQIEYIVQRRKRRKRRK